MIVEDNEDLIKLYQEEVDELNIKGEYFNDGRSAVDHYRSSDQSYDLIITDVRMPMKSGEGLVFDIKTMNPKQKIAAVTAYPGDLNLPATFDVKIYEKPISLYDVLREHLPAQVFETLDHG